MPIKLKCVECEQFDVSTRMRMVRCANAAVCGCRFPNEVREALCDSCALGLKEVT